MSSNKFIIIIPARYDSLRFPGKLLAKLKGKEILAWTYERAKSSEAAEVFIATGMSEGDKQIAELCDKIGARCVHTHDRHSSGTSRLAEAADKLELGDDELIVNLQGDEPLLPAAVINQLASVLATSKEAAMASLCVPITSEEELRNPNCVKVVRDANDYALYFSRSTVPVVGKDNLKPGQLAELLSACLWQRHLGIYAYLHSFLRQYVAWPASAYEERERLEQLRCLHYGAKLLVPQAIEVPPPGVDTPEELAHLENSSL